MATGWTRWTTLQWAGVSKLYVVHGCLGGVCEDATALRIRKLVTGRGAGGSRQER